MEMTNFGANDPLAVKLWNKSLDVEALNGDANSVIHHETETSTPQGKRFSAPNAPIRAELVADDSCCALGMTAWFRAGIGALPPIGRSRA